MVCRNWGCHQIYEYNEKEINKKECSYHPKHFEFGSINGLWPEQWVCCRKQWEAEGCTKGRHKGIPKNKIKRLCVNHGSINPKTNYPDSYCGKAVSEEEMQEYCIYHTGYIVSHHNGIEKWSCCTSISGVINEPCTHSKHKTVEWPNLEAKKLFVQK